jgi:glutamine amidotransferase
MSSPKVVIVDFGLGNLRSVAAAITEVGGVPEVTSDLDAIVHAEHLILPGVGAFRVAAERLETSGIGERVRVAANQGTPVLGICLGMQLLFDGGNEFGWSRGLRLIQGEVLPVVDSKNAEELRGTHIGWRALSVSRTHKEHPLWKKIARPDSFYFVHAFSAERVDPSNVLATVAYGQKELVVAVSSGNVSGVQFHPEKSGRPGLRLLKNFITA